MNDLCADLHQKRMRLIDLAAIARAKTDMMQSDGTLNEALAAFGCGRRFYAKSCSATDTVEDARRVRDDSQTEEGQKLAVERARGFKVAGRDEDVGDAIYFHRKTPRCFRRVIWPLLSRLAEAMSDCETRRRCFSRLPVPR